MIDWEKTTQIGTQDLSGFRPKVIVRCDKCNLSERVYTIRVKSQVIDNQIGWVCPKCISNTESEKQRRSEQLKTQWADKQYVEQRRGSSKQIWSDPIFRDKHAVAISDPELRRKYSESAQKSLAIQRNDPTYKARKSAASKALFEDPEFRNMVTERTRAVCRTEAFKEKMRGLWRDDLYRNRMAEIRRNLPKVSSIQNVLYGLLDDLGVAYFREHKDGIDDSECTIGPYSFDCVIPRIERPALLIECQGDYWHNLERTVRRDAAKASYITNNFSGRYELKYLWEHEFKNPEKIVWLLKYWLGINKLSIINFDFKDVQIRDCDAAQYRPFLAKYHYLQTGCRGGQSYGAYLGDKLIAVAIYSHPVRQNIAQSLGIHNEEIRELARFCIHPNYQMYNFGSWFLSRSIRLLPYIYKCIISYCDSTFNHNGALYRAANFKCDKVIGSDYWYVSYDGWVMHKKTLYNHAVTLGITESEFAAKHQYKKVYGGEKSRFVLWR